MRLSGINGERTLDVIAELIDPICNIALDEEITLFKKRELPEGMNPEEFAVNRIREQVPLLLKKHKNDTVLILSIIKGVSKDEYLKKLNLATLIFDITDLLTDEDMMNLFTSEQSEKISGSALENTEAQKE